MIAPRHVVDRDGDIWEAISNGHWRCLTTASCNVAGQDLANVCGPLHDVAAEALNRIRAEALRDAANELGPWLRRRGDDWLRARADELDGGAA